MKRLIAVLIATSAHAAPITPPAGWTLDPSLASPPSAQRFGGAETKVNVYAYRAPSPGAVLYVNRAEAEVASTDRDRLATAELEEPRSALRRAGAAAKAEQDSQQVVANQLEAVVRWRDASVIDSTRVLVAGDDKKLVAVTAQCVLGVEAAALAKACEAALATLDTEVTNRVALAIAQPEPVPPKSLPATITDGGKVGLPPIRLDPPAPETDRRPVYLGAGLIVLAAVFWWNRKKREQFESEHADVPDRVPRATAKAKARDEDADALHSAAESGDDRESK